MGQVEVIDYVVAFVIAFGVGLSFVLGMWFERERGRLRKL